MVCSDVGSPTLLRGCEPILERSSHHRPGGAHDQNQQQLQQAHDDSPAPDCHALVCAASGLGHLRWSTFSAPRVGLCKGARHAPKSARLTRLLDEMAEGPPALETTQRVDLGWWLDSVAVHVGSTGRGTVPVSSSRCWDTSDRALLPRSAGWCPDRKAQRHVSAWLHTQAAADLNSRITDLQRESRALLRRLVP